MNRKKRRILNRNKLIALSLAAIMSVGFGSVSVSAKEYKSEESSYSRLGFFESLFGSDDSGDTEEQIVESEKNYKSLLTVANKSISSYESRTLIINGVSGSVKAVRIGNTDYIPFRQAANLLGASYSYDSSSGTSVMSLSGLALSATSGNYVIYANGRPLFSISPTVIMSDGRMYIPLEIFAKAIGISPSVSSREIRFSGSVKPLKAAGEFYREDEVFWLARIIHAESRGEPLLGQIAVGNVVLNRVRSAEYPNTIYGVIFDKKYGVQFSPIIDGSIYNTPSYNATLAAKICLEGFDISDGSLFFLRPEMSTSSWIPNNRPYSFSVGKHDFYK